MNKPLFSKPGNKTPGKSYRVGAGVRISHESTSRVPDPQRSRVPNPQKTTRLNERSTSRMTHKVNQLNKKITEYITNQ